MEIVQVRADDDCGSRAGDAAVGGQAVVSQQTVQENGLPDRSSEDRFCSAENAQRMRTLAADMEAGIHVHEHDLIED